MQTVLDRSAHIIGIVSTRTVGKENHHECSFQKLTSFGPQSKLLHGCTAHACIYVYTHSFRNFTSKLQGLLCRHLHGRLSKMIYFLVFRRFFTASAAPVATSSSSSSDSSFVFMCLLPRAFVLLSFFDFFSFSFSVFLLLLDFSEAFSLRTLIVLTCPQNFSHG